MWSVFYHVAAYACILVKYNKATALYPDVYVLLYFALCRSGWSLGSKVKQSRDMWLEWIMFFLGWVSGIQMPLHALQCHCCHNLNKDILAVCNRIITITIILCVIDSTRRFKHSQKCLTYCHVKETTLRLFELCGMVNYPSISSLQEISKVWSWKDEHGQQQYSGRLCDVQFVLQGPKCTKKISPTPLHH